MRRPNYVTHEPVDEASKMAAPNVVSWLESQKGKTKLIIDDYLFESNGKGKAPTVRYWACATGGCAVRVKTDGNAVQGVVNQGDHAHINDIQHIKDMKLKVICEPFIYWRLEQTSD